MDVRYAGPYFNYLFSLLPPPLEVWEPQSWNLPPTPIAFERPLCEKEANQRAEKQKQINLKSNYIFLFEL